MTASKRLEGIDLIDCAKANAKQGVETAAGQCGYGENVEEFRQALKQACQDIGVDLNSFSDLITDQQVAVEMGAIEIAPETKSDL
ncbi:MAG: hypothetical protein SXA11_00915 [Cyanobacteriota bacterium]|nr:hypothetical protein [Cyanobacteriota bacterium]